MDQAFAFLKHKKAFEIFKGLLTHENSDDPNLVGQVQSALQIFNLLIMGNTVSADLIKNHEFLDNLLDVTFSKYTTVADTSLLILGNIMID